MASDQGKTDGGPKLFGPEMLQDPYPVYHRLRAAHPLTWVAQIHGWVVTGYEAVAGALRSPQLSSDRFDRIKERLAGRGLEGLVDDRARSMLHMDAPDHTR